ncbi:MAG: redox-regulated ATPase YchF [Deltaproteobacteria bacterium]|nr:redox-regulated ATPase YchF [Deltaproteobacteria bacterium]
MKVGIVGLPRSGKTTVFSALTGQNPDPGLPPGRTTLGTVRVRDPRLAALHALYPPAKLIFAEVVFSDVAGAPGRKGLDRASLTAMHDFDAFAQVLRGFPDEAGAAPDPQRELADLEAELVLADLDVLERKLPRLQKGEKPSFTNEKELLTRLKEQLDANRPLRLAGLTPAEVRNLAGYAFLSLKPLLGVLNVPEAAVRDPAPAPLAAAAEEHQVRLLVLSGEVERQIAELDDASARDFLADLGLTESAAQRFIAAAYGLMDLISFFTVGDDEVRAWTIRRGTEAVTAAGKIHTDLEQGFIRAEVIRHEDLLALGSEAKCREAGKLRLEGKVYVVQDGDILHVRHNK